MGSSFLVWKTIWGLLELFFSRFGVILFLFFDETRKILDEARKRRFGIIYLVEKGRFEVIFKSGKDEKDDLSLLGTGLCARGPEAFSTKNPEYAPNFLVEESRSGDAARFRLKDDLGRNAKKDDLGSFFRRLKHEFILRRRFGASLPSKIWGYSSADKKNDLGKTLKGTILFFRRRLGIILSPTIW